MAMMSYVHEIETVYNILQNPQTVPLGKTGAQSHLRAFTMIVMTVIPEGMREPVLCPSSSMSDPSPCALSGAPGVLATPPPPTLGPTPLRSCCCLDHELGEPAVGPCTRPGVPYLNHTTNCRQHTASLQDCTSTPQHSAFSVVMLGVALSMMQHCFRCNTL